MNFLEIKFSKILAIVGNDYFVLCYVLLYAKQHILIPETCKCKHKESKTGQSV